MMNYSTFQSSLRESVKLLQDIGLFGSKGTKVISKDGVSGEFKSACQQSNYNLVYKVAVRNMDYDFTLEDKSIFQFSYDLHPGLSEIPEVRFAFFQNPTKYVSYTEFLDFQRELGLIDETNEEIGDLLINEYEQYLDEEQLNMSSTTMRYDIDTKNYNPLIHSISHLHIGHLNNIRIPCNKIISPLKFVLFVVKHIYYYKWKEFIEANDIAYNQIVKNAKNSCPDLNERYWKEHSHGIHEDRDLFLS